MTKWQREEFMRLHLSVDMKFLKDGSIALRQYDIDRGAFKYAVRTQAEGGSHVLMPDWTEETWDALEEIK